MLVPAGNRTSVGYHATVTRRNNSKCNHRVRCLPNFFHPPFLAESLSSLPSVPPPPHTHTHTYYRSEVSGRQCTRVMFAELFYFPLRNVIPVICWGRLFPYVVVEQRSGLHPLSIKAVLRSHVDEAGGPNSACQVKLRTSLLEHHHWTREPGQRDNMKPSCFFGIDPDEPCQGW
jgi:hypothetical protein